MQDRQVTVCLAIGWLVGLFGCADEGGEPADDCDQVLSPGTADTAALQAALIEAPSDDAEVSGDADLDEPPVADTSEGPDGGDPAVDAELDAAPLDQCVGESDRAIIAADEELQTTELGRALDQALTESGTLQSIFLSNDLTTSFGQDFATAGEGDAFMVGRGTGGLGIRGTGRGGGGDGFGRVHGVGDIDTGGRRGDSAGLGRREQRAPRAHVEHGTAEVNGFLSREEIERVVRRHSRGFRYCYERELQDDAELAGQITVNWTVDLDGTVSRCSIEEDTMDNRSVESCVLREVRRMRFPEPDGGMFVVRYPFTFRSPQDEE